MQARFTYALLRDLGSLDFPMERIYSQTVSGRPKTEVLEKLAAAAPPGCRLTFVEDKLSTLEAVAKAPGFEAWQLYLGAPRLRLRAREAGTVAHSTPADSGLGLQHAAGARTRSREPAHHRHRRARAACAAPR